MDRILLDVMWGEGASSNAESLPYDGYRAG